MATPSNRVLHPAEVVGVQDLSPHMRRVTVAGDALRAMAVELPGQWMKVFFPSLPGAKAHGRAYTIRHHDAAAGTMDLDFVLHGDNGLASRWAGQVRAGEVLEVAGPREGYRIDPTATDHLLIGDSTSLPAIAAILESLPSGTGAQVFVELADAEEGALLPSRPAVAMRVFTSGAALPGTTGQLDRAIMAAELPGVPQVWLAGEAAMMRAVRTHLLASRGIPRSAITSSGYWRVGVEDHRDRE